jgi:hypothetical protein
MNIRSWYFALGAGLLAFSVIVYTAQIIVFHKPGDTFFYLFQDLAFVPTQVLLVMLLLDRWLRKKEREAMMSKLNMVIGVFFSEIGTVLIKTLIKMDATLKVPCDKLMIAATWKDADFASAAVYHKFIKYELNFDASAMNEMKVFLLSRRQEMLRLLENPNLLEHETFTDLLWAVFHLADELGHRDNLSILPLADMEHLKGDAVRALGLLVDEWLVYMKHLRRDYPYLFSLAVRINPFNPDASPVMQK